MPIAAIALVLVSCFAHAGWNLLIKRSDHAMGVMWWSLVVSLGLLSPVTAWFFLTGRSFSFPVWQCLMISSLGMGVYIYSLMRAYDGGDLSVVYPIARSTPLFVALWASIVLGERISVPGAVGIGLVVLAAVMLAAVGSARASGPTWGVGIGWAVLTALASSVYSVADKAAMVQVEAGAGRVVYMHLQFAGMLAGLTLGGMGSGFWSRVRPGKDWRSVAGVGVFQPAAYLLVLMAMGMKGAPVSYIVAMRQFSVVIGVVFGWRVLRESRGLERLGPPLVMVAGWMLVAGVGQ